MSDLHFSTVYLLKTYLFTGTYQCTDVGPKAEGNPESAFTAKTIATAAAAAATAATSATQSHDDERTWNAHATQYGGFFCHARIYKQPKDSASQCTAVPLPFKLRYWNSIPTTFHQPFLPSAPQPWVTVALSQLFAWLPDESG